LADPSQAATFGLRWFTPLAEVDLCGHATLATAFVLFQEGLVTGNEVHFATQSGVLTVGRTGDLLRMDFPSRPAAPMAAPAGLSEALGAQPQEVLQARDLLAVFPQESALLDLQPDFPKLARLDIYAVCVTAPGEGADFVSRFFAPRLGVDEDPVTGSAHCTLIPYWANRLGKKNMRAIQVSRRRGEVICEDRGERVVISGRACEYLRGEIYLPE
jgi:PhzF family phenazine biosynthesis protein